MTSLIRCRGSATEIAVTFDAVAEPDLEWRPTAWPGEQVLMVTSKGSQRRLRTGSWGLSPTAFLQPTPQPLRGVVFARDLASANTRLVASHSLERCLIIVEDFAYPTGEPGRRTRAWAGLWDEPVSAWAGLCTADGLCCAGVVSPANALIARVSSTMPLLLSQKSAEQWLEARAGLLSLADAYLETDYYLEPSDERWANAATIE